MKHLPNGISEVSEMHAHNRNKLIIHSATVILFPYFSNSANSTIFSTSIAFGGQQRWEYITKL